jgi:hypothetical protein
MKGTGQGSEHDFNGIGINAEPVQTNGALHRIAFMRVDLQVYKFWLSKHRRT